MDRLNSLVLRLGNHAQLETLFMSVLHYTSAKESKPLDQKLGIMVLTKFALLWLQPSAGQSHAEVEPIPGIERFFYDSVLPICFDIPLRKHFDYSDAHSYAVSSIAPDDNFPSLTRITHVTGPHRDRCLYQDARTQAEGGSYSGIMQPLFTICRFSIK